MLTHKPHSSHQTFLWWFFVHNISANKNLSLFVCHTERCEYLAHELRPTLLALGHAYCMSLKPTSLHVSVSRGPLIGQVQYAGCNGVFSLVVPL